MNREPSSKHYPKATALFIMKFVNWLLVDTDSGGIDFLEFRDDDEAAPGIHAAKELTDLIPSGDAGAKAGNMLAWKPAGEMKNGPHPRTAPLLPETFTARELAAFMLNGIGDAIQGVLGPIGGSIDENALLKVGGMQDKWEREALRAAYEAAHQPQDVVGAPDFEADDYVSRDAWIKAMVCQLLEPKPETAEHPPSSTTEQPTCADADREELARLITEAEARRKEEERKAAEVARLAAERADIALQREAQEAKARAERAELERQAEGPQESHATTLQGQAPGAEVPSLGRSPLQANQALRNRTRERKDALTLELEDIIAATEREGRITAIGVMAKLKASAGTGGCVTDIAATGDGVIWENSKGRSRALTLEALDARLRRMRKSPR